VTPTCDGLDSTIITSAWTFRRRHRTVAGHTNWNFGNELAFERQPAERAMPPRLHAATTLHLPERD